MHASKGSLYIWHALWDPCQWPSSHRPRWNEMPRRRSNSWWMQLIFCICLVQGFSVKGCKWYESITVKSNQYINIIQVMIRWDLSLSMSVLHFWVVQAVPGLVQLGWNKAGRGQWIFLWKYSLLGSGSWHARLLQCHSCRASWNFLPTCVSFDPSSSMSMPSNLFCCLSSAQWQQFRQLMWHML